MEDRKIIQITASTSGDSNLVMALCADGSVWRYTFDHAKWIQLENIPHPKQEKDEFDIDLENTYVQHIVDSYLEDAE